MSCIYNSFSTGICEMVDTSIEMPGCDEDGNCLCDSDEEPSYTC